MRMAFRTLLITLAILGFAQMAQASDPHGGGAVKISVSPRTEARIGDQQLVLLYANRKAFQDTGYNIFGGTEVVKLADPRIAVFLENYADATPTEGAQLDVSINFLPEELIEAAPGVYLSGPVILGGGRNEIELNYTIGKESGTLALTLVVPGGASSGTGTGGIEAPPAAIPSWLFALLALLIYGTVLWLFLRRRTPATNSQDETVAEPSKQAA